MNKKHLKASAFGNMVRTGAAFIVLTLVQMPAQALDLAQVYEQAKAYDPAVKAAQSNYLAERQTIKQGKALLRPTIAAHARAGKTRYKSDVPTINLNRVPDVERCIPASVNTSTIAQAAVDCANELGGSVNITDGIDSTYTGTEYGVVLTQPLFDQNRKGNYEKTKILSKKSEILYQQAKSEVLFNVTEAYLQALQAKDSLQRAKVEDKTLSSQLRYVQTNLKNGVGRASDLYELNSVKQLQSSQIILHKNALDAAINRLSSLAGRPINERELQKFKRKIPMRSLQPSSQQAWIDLSKKYSTQIHNAGIEMQLAKAEYKSQKKNRWPVLNLLASWNKTQTSGGQGFTPAAQTSILALDLNVPVYQGGALKASKEKAYHQLEAAKQRKYYQEQQLGIAVSALYSQISANVEAYKVYQSSLAAARRADKTLSKGASQGVVTVAELFRARKTLQQIETNIQKVRFEYLLNKLKLRQLVGVLSEEDLLAVNTLIR